ncbi:MAG TPA: acylphosphatase, partial [archaeon]|nr:acylphosphatase [archaeon]
RVQGVFFRASIAEKARGLGVKGWVRNARDSGVVEGVFQGRNDAVKALIEFLKASPGKSEVERIEVREVKSGNAFEGFSVQGN